MTEEQKKNMTPAQFAEYKQQLHAEAQKQFADQFKRDKALSVAQLEELKATLKEADDKNDTLRILNQAKEDAEKKLPGIEVEATVNIDPETGNRTIVSASVDRSIDDDTDELESEGGDYGSEDPEDEDEVVETSDDDIIEDYGEEEDDEESELPDLDDIEFDEEAAREEREEFEKNVEITANDIINIAKDESNNKFQCSTDTASEILLIIEKIRNNELRKEDVTYKMMPDQVKEYIDDSIALNNALANGPVNTSIYNGYRNTLTKVLIDHYMTTITSAKYMDNIAQQIANVYDMSTLKMSPVLKKFNSGKLNNLIKLYDATDDEEEKTRIKACIDAIEDAYNLTRLKEMKPIKIKSFEMEQPQKVYREIMYQYIKDADHSFYDAEMCVKVLQRHLNDKGLAKTEKDAQKFMLVFCKFCDKNQYKVTNQDEHAFMYFVTYNIMLLDAYKEEDYEEFATPFLNNIIEVIDHSIKNKI